MFLPSILIASANALIEQEVNRDDQAQNNSSMLLYAAITTLAVMSIGATAIKYVQRANTLARQKAEIERLNNSLGTISPERSRLYDQLIEKAKKEKQLK